MTRLRTLLASVLLAAGCSLTAWAAPAAELTPTTASATVGVDRTLEGDKTCTGCHDENENKPILAMYKTRHGVKADSRTPGCQSCHGASVAHVKNAAGASTRPAPERVFKANAQNPDELRQACLACHKGGNRQHWGGSKHEAAGLSCNNCHQVHTHGDKVMSKVTQQEVCFACHKSERAQTHRQSTHPLAEGKMACSDCHNPHGSIGPKLMKKDSINETCFSCHAEKRGPFLWEHEPVTENCANCHSPHGSNTAPMLKQRAPWLCQNCHSGDHGAQVNSGANLPSGALAKVITPAAPAGTTNTSAVGTSPRAQMVGKACLACHMVVHGSNHPAGSKFSR